MASGEVRVGDVGTQFLVTLQDDDTVVDLSSASTLQFIFHKPDGTNVTKTATLYTDGTDGKIYYNSQSGFLDTAGHWKFQIYVVIGANSWKSDIARFTVHPNL